MNSKKRIFGALFPALILLAISLQAVSQTEKRNPHQLNIVSSVADHKKQTVANNQFEMIDLQQLIPGLKLDIRYATKNNFTEEVIYSAPKAFLRKPVAEALKKVQDSLAFHHLGLKVFDAYRPYAATLRFHEVYPDTNFVANPQKGSRHNRGCAVDVTLVSLFTGNELKMPTEFDDFSEKANSNYTRLSDEVIHNRKFLFDIMSHFGFKHLSTEWWHFDYTGWEKFPLMDLTFDELLILNPE